MRVPRKVGVQRGLTRFAVLDRVPTVRSRQLGHELARAMLQSGRNAAEVADILAWSPSKVSRLLSGKRIPSTVDVAAFLATCRVVGTHRDELLEHSRSAYEPTWWRDYGDRLPIHLATLVDNEEAATTITGVHDTLVPDLLQTPDYLRALLCAQPIIPEGEIEDRVAATMRRQRLDQPGPARFRFFVHEYAITRTGPGDEVMSGQVQHLLRMAARPNIEIRVVLEASGILERVAFTLLEFEDLPAVAYVEHLTSMAFMEHQATIAAYQRQLAVLDNVALNEDESRTWLDIAARKRSGMNSRPEEGGG